MQECGTKSGTERGVEVMWFHTGNYTEMTQEAQQLLRVTAQSSSVGLAAYP